MEEALEGLLKALPRCCNCQTAAAVVIDFYRWPLCERCWRAVPGSDDEKPSADMRGAVRAAQKAFRTSLTDSLSRIPSVNEIPPSSAPPQIDYPSDEVRELKTSLEDELAFERWRASRLRSIAIFLGAVVAALVVILMKTRS